MYDVILADPPWSFSTWSDKGKGRSPDRHYPTMSLDEIKRLDVSAIANRSCALFLWVTWPFIEKSFEIIRAWGFTYRTVGFVWVKSHIGFTGFAMGTGYYTRANSEPCLLAVRGKMSVTEGVIP